MGTTTTQLICDDGFFKKNGVCIDIDECKNNKKNNCNKNNGICTNTPGSFTCACKEGFEGDGVKCSKITTTTTTTTTTSTTTTTTTTTALVCGDGFFKKNGVCNDINECRSPKKNNCNKKNGSCTNPEGGFTCSCNDGFQGDG